MNLEWNCLNNFLIICADSIRMDEEELLDIRMSLEDLLPPEEDDLLGSDDDE